ncbi:MAG TPA: Ig-like domain-containing protein [Rhodocyclaceae bacterium]|nr:Ig-like domain-containing protein [Rhodocyclaceae bacterium]
MKKTLATLSSIALLAGGLSAPAGAALAPAPAGVGPINSAIGDPQWYEDTSGLRLDLCLDQNGMCLVALANPALPPAVPTNWDPAGESFYYMATATIADGNVDAMFEAALEAGFAGAVASGGQSVFARIRITLNPRVAEFANQTFTVTHPFGTTTVLSRDVNQNTMVTQDWPGLVAGDFTSAVADAPLLAGTVNADGRSIGPFLVPTTPRVTTLDGKVYLATPGALATVTGGPLGNVFTIATGAYSQTQNLFSVQAKVSGCAAGNVAPLAVADPTAVAVAGAATVINVLANDTAGTVAINPATVTLTQPTNGTVVKNADGTVSFTSDVAGPDSFTYTVQDNCALTSNAATVPVLVERLVANRAEFRPKTGKWTVSGESSQTVGNTVTLHKGSVTGPVIGSATVQPDGSWKFVGKSKTAAGPAQQNLTVESSSGAHIGTPLKLR